jgi:hypothetical protein
MVVLSTSMGDIKIELYADKAPVTVKNFLDYAKAGYYDGTTFHRVIPNFMIQGGGMTADMQEKKGGRPPIKNESDNGLKNETGTSRWRDVGSRQRDVAVLHQHQGQLFPQPGERARQGRLRGLRQGRRGHGRRQEDRAGEDDEQGPAPERAGRRGRRSSRRRSSPSRSERRRLPAAVDGGGRRLGQDLRLDLAAHVPAGEPPVAREAAVQDAARLRHVAAAGEDELVGRRDRAHRAKTPLQKT